MLPPFLLLNMSRPEIALHKKKCNERICKAYAERL